MDRAPHPAFGPRAAALSRDPVRAVGRPTCLSRDSRTYFLMVSEKPSPCHFGVFCVCAASEILCTVLIPGALAEFFLI